MIRSICPVCHNGWWDVRIRFRDGTEKLLHGTYPFTFHQAEMAAEIATRDYRHDHV